MSVIGWVQILIFSVVILALTKPLGTYMFYVFEGDRQPLAHLFGPIERWTYSVCGIDPKEQQNWKDYALALLIFSGLTMLVTYGVQRLQHVLPLNPQNLGPVTPELAFGTAVSFATNTNWQAYGGRIDHELFDTDGRAHLAELYFRRRRHRRDVSHRAWIDISR